MKPYPDLLETRKKSWKIRQGRPSLNREQGVFTVPPEEDDEDSSSINVRTAAHSRLVYGAKRIRIPEDVPRWLYNAVEALRCAHRATTAMVAVTEEVTQDIETHRFQLIKAASVMKKAEVRFGLGPELMGLAEYIHHLLAAGRSTRDVVNYGRCEAVAPPDTFTEDKDRDNWRAVEWKYRKAHWYLLSVLARKTTPRTTLLVCRELIALFRSYSDENSANKKAAQGPRSKKGAIPLPADFMDKFGDLSIVEPPRTIPMSNRALNSISISSDEGSVLRNPTRWFLDKKIFERKRKVQTATLLIDGSGSMSWDMSDLQRILREVPAAQVAIYSGSDEGGELAILVKNGLRVPDRKIYPEYGGNVVDGPAWAWLATQPGPRIVITDCGMTGRHDNLIAESTKRSVLRFAANHNIRVCEEVEEAVEQLRRRA